jgi:two-component system chemotaxis response regulator CheB
MHSSIVVVGVGINARSSFDLLRAYLARPLCVPMLVASHAHLSGRPVNVTLTFDKDRPVAGRVYVPPPHYHLLVERGHLALALDNPPVPPSIDALFESAHAVFCSNVIGVFLGDARSDGTRGLTTLEAAKATVLRDRDHSVHAIAEAITRTLQSKTGGAS